MGTISMSNRNKPTSPFWGKLAAALLFISATLQGSGLSTENHKLVWIGFGLTIVAGLIPIFTGTDQPTQPVQATSTV